jgi:hypothetical protein
MRDIYSCNIHNKKNLLQKYLFNIRKEEVSFKGIYKYYKKKNFSKSNILWDSLNNLPTSHFHRGIHLHIRNQESLIDNPHYILDNYQLIEYNSNKSNYNSYNFTWIHLNKKRMGKNIKKGYFKDPAPLIYCILYNYFHHSHKFYTTKRTSCK